MQHDQQLEIEHAGFRQASFNYVCKLQAVHAMKQYELIEPVSFRVGTRLSGFRCTVCVCVCMRGCVVHMYSVCELVFTHCMYTHTHTQSAVCVYGILCSVNKNCLA